MRHSKALHRSWLAFRSFDVVSFVYVFSLVHDHSRWSASPVNVVVGRASAEAGYANEKESDLGPDSPGLLTSAILAVCGPSQAERDAQVPVLAGTPAPQPVVAIDH